MRISIFGLGYVGIVTSACLARDGHDVMGVDVNPDKVAALAAGRSPIVEPGLAELLEQGVRQGRIGASGDSARAVAETDVSLISVGTPSQANGAPDLGFVLRVCHEIGQAIAAKDAQHTVVVRSTVPPGTTSLCREVISECAGDNAVSVAFNPEFLREGSAIYDYDNPPYTVVGADDAVAERQLREIYEGVTAPLIVVALRVSELLKYVSNSWHATKIVFANEVGRLAKEWGVDGREVMALMVQDHKLNVSGAYLRPGFAYGGSCLPKDVRALVHAASQADVPVPLLTALQTSNQQQVDLALEAVLQHRPRRVALLGLAFKEATDDLRESPAVTLAKRLIGEGCELRIYAPDVSMPRLLGTNLAYIRENLPHFEGLLVDGIDDLIGWGQVIVVAQADDKFAESLGTASEGRVVVDLAGLPTERLEAHEYHGIAW